MLIQTDERYVPWSDDLCTGYEHIHRYLLAQRYAAGKKVLDLACGEGYGSYFLSQTAKSVLGVDISTESVTHAQETYKRPNLAFCTGSIIAVPPEAGNAFDVIVCFEALEHIAEQDELLAEVKRLLTPGGMFIVSTPNKPVYSEQGTRQNPYHVKELDFSEFEVLLRQSFEHLTFYGQKTYAASKIFPIHTPSVGIEERRIDQQLHGFVEEKEEEQHPRYFIAVASNLDSVSSVNTSYLTDVSSRSGYVKWEHPQVDALTQDSGFNPRLSLFSRVLIKLLRIMPFYLDIGQKNMRMSSRALKKVR